MKKRIVAFLAIGMGLLCTACGVPNNEKKSVNMETESTSETPKALQKVTIDETLIYDANGIKVTATGLEGNVMGASVKVLIENNSGKNITVQTRNSSINGYMMDPVFSADVANGKKSNDTISFSKSDLEKYNIDAIGEIEFDLYIVNADSWLDEIDQCRVLIKTSAADSYEQKYEVGGQTVYDANGVKIVFVGTKNDSIFGPSIVAYIENNSGKNITVQLRDVSVNDFMTDAVFSSGVVNGKKAVDDITFMSSDLNTNGITKINKIEFKFNISADGNFMDYYETDPIAVTFS